MDPVVVLWICLITLMVVVASMGGLLVGLSGRVSDLEEKLRERDQDEMESMRTAMSGPDPEAWRNQTL